MSGSISLILAFALVFLSCAARAAEWVRIHPAISGGHTQVNADEYVDLESIQTSGSSVTFWRLLDWPYSRGAVLQELTFDQIDCAGHTHSVAVSYEYSPDVEFKRDLELTTSELAPNERLGTLLCDGSMSTAERISREPTAAVMMPDAVYKARYGAFPRPNWPIRPPTLALSDSASATPSSQLADTKSWLRNCLPASPPGALSNQDLVAAKKSSARLDAKQRKSAKATFGDAFDLYKSGEFVAAAQLFSDGLLRDPANDLAHFYYAETLSRLGKNSDAAGEFALAKALAKSQKQQALAQARLLSLKCEGK